MTDAKKLSPIQRAAHERQRLIEIIRTNPNISSPDACSKMCLPLSTARQHLCWAATKGYIKSAGTIRQRTWVAVDPPPLVEVLRAERDESERRAADEALMQRRREILSYIRSHDDVTTRQVQKVFTLTIAAAERELRALFDAGCVEKVHEGHFRGWQWLKSLPRPGDPKTAPVVGVKAPHKFCEPGPVITKVEHNVKYTFQCAPRPRFHVELPRGGGVISGDNPRLTAALMGAST